ncbi:ATP-binding cassette domain-containing protein [Vibrio sp. FNV 38]|nr:ATP-binding cassette domain-containing protein [Vibrio sp. FNV 38]
MTTALLSIQNLSLVSPTRTLVQSLSFDLKAGEILAVMGPSGTGKSMLSRAIGGFLPKEIQMQGSIRFLGSEVGGLPLILRKREQRPGVIFQDALQALNPLANVETQLALALTGKYTKLDNTHRAEVLDLLVRLGFDNPKAILKMFPSQLSGGQRQRICIAIALLNSQHLIIADEPTSALDPITEQEILSLFRSNVKQRKLGGVLITHDLASAMKCDKLLVISDGQMVALGTPSEVLESQHTFCQQMKALVE